MLVPTMVFGSNLKDIIRKVGSIANGVTFACCITPLKPGTESQSGYSWVPQTPQTKVNIPKGMRHLYMG